MFSRSIKNSQGLSEPAIFFWLFEIFSENQFLVESDQ